jgi:hypothetical protein
MKILRNEENQSGLGGGYPLPVKLKIKCSGCRYFIRKVVRDGENREIGTKQVPECSLTGKISSVV